MLGGSCVAPLSRSPRGGAMQRAMHLGRLRAEAASAVGAIGSVVLNETIISIRQERLIIASGIARLNSRHTWISRFRGVTGCDPAPSILAIAVITPLAVIVNAYLYSVYRLLSPYGRSDIDLTWHDDTVGNRFALPRLLQPLHQPNRQLRMEPTFPGGDPASHCVPKACSSSRVDAATSATRGCRRAS